MSQSILSVAAAVFLLAATSALAQQANTAIVVGTVVDASDASVPGATVTLRHLGTNATTEAVTDERGQYRTPPLRIGEYEISVELSGFKRFDQRAVAALELLHAAGNHVDQDVRIVDRLECFLDVIVSHGWAIRSGENR